jgi:hypothetical protein
MRSVIIATGTHWTAASALPAALAEDQRGGLAFYDYPAVGSICSDSVSEGSRMARSCVALASSATTAS